MEYPHWQMDVFYRVHLQWYSCPSRPLFEHCHYGNRSLMPCTLSALLYLNSFLVFSTKPFTEPQLIQDSVRGEVFAWWSFFLPSLSCLFQKVLSPTNAIWQGLFDSHFFSSWLKNIMAAFIAKQILQFLFPPSCPPGYIVFNENSTHSTATFSFWFLAV